VEPSYLHLEPEQPLPKLASGPFVTVIVSDENVSDAWQNQTCEWLVAAGTLYVVTWCVDCEGWHDKVDWAVLAKFAYGEIPDDSFVMTTWHDNEPLSEAFWYAGNCAILPDVDVPKMVVLHISGKPKKEALLTLYHESQIIPSDEEEERAKPGFPKSFLKFFSR
jgi:hypothetical protein